MSDPGNRKQKVAPGGGGRATGSLFIRTEFPCRKMESSRDGSHTNESARNTTELSTYSKFHAMGILPQLNI